MSEPKLKGWNHIPEAPIQVSPFFRWPLRPLSMLRWVWESWLLISEKLIILAISCACYLWLSPSLEEAAQLEVGWIAQIYIRNLVLIFCIAGLLHLWFYKYSAQGDRLKYDPRPLMLKGKQFTLGGQVRDNMFWTLGSGVFFWSAYEVLMFWSLANGYAPLVTWGANPIWFVAIFLLIPLWESFYFYWIHRLIHLPFLYKHIHAVHHRNINVGPWSGLSMHPAEHAIYLGSVLIHFVVGAHPLHIIFHLQYYTLTAVTTHTGFQGLVIKDKNRLALGTFHHQMHHRYFECNYGSLEMPWDKWFGSFHDGTVEANERMQARRKSIMGK
ncbi:sterol desaturase family protein [Ruegeria sp. SCPT10]|uniref:sterol desaturase family protein n=1 Tax=Ruegeria sp. SCP10 TaxID=3141377 RepID=UPI0033395B59